MYDMHTKHGTSHRAAQWQISAVSCTGYILLVLGAIDTLLTA